MVQTQEPAETIDLSRIILVQQLNHATTFLPVNTMQKSHNTVSQHR